MKTETLNSAGNYNVKYEIYDGFLYYGPGSKPAWVPRGNSDKQEEARRLARLASRYQTGMVLLTIRATSTADSMDQSSSSACAARFGDSTPSHNRRNFSSRSSSLIGRSRLPIA